MFLENPEIGGTRLIQIVFHTIGSSSSVVPFVRLKYVTLFAVHSPYSLSSKVHSFRLRALGLRARSRTQLRLTGEQYCLPNTLDASLFFCPRSNPALSLSLFDFESHATISHYPRSTSDIVVAGSPTEHMFRSKGGTDRPPGEDRYSVWALRMQNVFDYCGLLDILEGKITKPSLGDAAEVIWKKINAAA